MIAYATKHGISYLTEYLPGAEILGYAERTAKENPDLHVSQRPFRGRPNTFTH
jgi:hypothetical protein